MYTSFNMSMTRNGLKCLFPDTQQKPRTLFAYIGSIYGFQRRCMYVKRTWMDTQLLLSRKEIPHKFLCQGHHVNLPPPMKYTGKTHIIRHIRNILHSGIFCVEVDKFIVMNLSQKKSELSCQIFVLYYNNQIVSVLAI